MPMKISTTICTLALLLQLDALLAQETATANGSLEEAKDCGACDVNGASSEKGYMHRGKWVGEYESTNVIAELKSFSAELVYVHMQDHTYVYRVSVFEVIQPEEYRGEKITIHVRPSGGLCTFWTQVGRTYEMSVPSEFLLGLGGFVTPDLVTIFKERSRDGV